LKTDIFIVPLFAAVLLFMAVPVRALEDVYADEDDSPMVISPSATAAADDDDSPMVISPPAATAADDDDGPMVISPSAATAADDDDGPMVISPPASGAADGDNDSAVISPPDLADDGTEDAAVSVQEAEDAGAAPRITYSNEAEDGQKRHGPPLPPQRPERSAGLRIAAGKDFFIPEAYVRLGLSKKRSRVYISLGGGGADGASLVDGVDLGVKLKGSEYQFAFFREWHTGGRMVNLYFGPGIVIGYYSYDYNYMKTKIKTAAGLGTDAGVQSGVELKLGRSFIIGADTRIVLYARYWNTGSTSGITYTAGSGFGFMF
jgi:hypothetical protein